MQRSDLPTLWASGAAPSSGCVRRCSSLPRTRLRRDVIELVQAQLKALANDSRKWKIEIEHLGRPLGRTMAVWITPVLSSAGTSSSHIFLDGQQNTNRLDVVVPLLRSR